MAFHSENFVSVRRLYPLVTPRVRSRLEVADPSSEDEHDYRDLLSEANLNFFHREYTIALQNYMSLRQKILQQSHPELPRIPGAGGLWALDWSKIQLDRIVELARRAGGTVTPGDPVRSRLGDSALIRRGEFRADPQLDRWSSVGIDTRPPASDPTLRDRARTLVKEAKFDEAARQYTAAAEAAVAAGQTELAADIHNESAVMLATYASGTTRTATLRQSLESLTKAEQLYARAGNTDAVSVLRSNRANIEADIPTTPTRSSPGGPRPTDPVTPVPGPLIPGGGTPDSPGIGHGNLANRSARQRDDAHLADSSQAACRTDRAAAGTARCRRMAGPRRGARKARGHGRHRQTVRHVPSRRFDHRLAGTGRVGHSAARRRSTSLAYRRPRSTPSASTKKWRSTSSRTTCTCITSCCRSRSATRMWPWACSSRVSPNTAACCRTRSSTWASRVATCG